IAFYHFRNPQLSPSVKDLIVTQEFSSKKSLTSCEGLLYKRQASAGFCFSLLPQRCTAKGAFGLP
ncbi:hypothetical protein, partial [Vibrio vulnificus]|uniref:hypothetical protein n=1 Tax=Vibrio vulnificus TaxID=672 RepID=UPI004059F4E0